MNEEIKQKFCREFGSDRVLLEEPMKRHTTFRIGGPAEVFVMPGNLEEMQRILEICRTEDLPYFILGNGSNLLVSDRGYRGVVIQLDRNFGESKSRRYGDPCISGSTAFYDCCSCQKSITDRI